MMFSTLVKTFESQSGIFGKAGFSAVLREKSSSLEIHLEREFSGTRVAGGKTSKT